MNLLPTLALFLFPAPQDGCGLETTALPDDGSSGVDMVELPYVHVQDDLAMVLTVGADARLGFFRRQDQGWIGEGWVDAGSIALFTERDVASAGELVFAGDPWGSDGSSTGGAVQVFSHQASGWTRLDPLLPPPGGNWSNFGQAVVAEDDRLWVSSSDSVLVYRIEAGSFVLEDVIDDRDGPVVKGPLAASGDRFLVGADFLFLPAAHAYRRLPSGDWVYDRELVSPGGSLGGHYGESVAIDGDIAVVSAPLESLVHVFEDSGAGWEASFSIQSSEPEFGSSLDLDGTTLVVGSPLADDGGALHVYERQDDGTWMATDTLTTPDGHTSRGIGQNVAVDGNVVVGTQSDLGMPAFLYELGGGASTTGPGHPGIDGRTPRLDVVTCASDAEALSVSIEDGRPGALGVLWIGRSAAERQLFGATVHVGGPLLQLVPHTLMADPNGMGSATLRLTNRGALPPGFELHLQAAYMDADASRGVSLSNGLRIGD